MSRTRTPWCSISSLTSTSTCSGMSAGSTSISISRRMNSRMPPCCLTPFGSPLTMTGIVTCSMLVHRDAVEVGVQHLVGDRIELKILDQHARVARAGELQRDQRVGARLGVQNLEQRLGRHGDRRRLAAALVARRRARPAPARRGACAALRSSRTCPATVASSIASMSFPLAIGYSAIGFSSESSSLKL